MWLWFDVVIIFIISLLLGTLSVMFLAGTRAFITTIVKTRRHYLRTLNALVASIKVCLQHVNWTDSICEYVHSNGSVHSARTDWAPTVLVSLQPVKSWRWPMSVSCNWVDLLQVSSVQFSSRAVNKAQFERCVHGPRQWPPATHDACSDTLLAVGFSSVVRNYKYAVHVFGFF